MSRDLTAPSATLPAALPTALPPIEALLPHRGSMLLLDRVVDFAGNALVAEYSPRADAWYADAAGNMPGWLGIELMAQAVAAQVALTRRAAGLPLKMGALLGTRAYRMAERAAGSFAAQRRLRIRVVEDFRDASGLAAYACQIAGDSDGGGDGDDGRMLASATLKVYEPEDFHDFLQGAGR